MKRILTFGVFDYFHLGHLRLLAQCREYADYLIVAVQNGEFVQKFKPEAKILYSTEERVELLSAIKLVNEVVVYDEVSVSTIEKFYFDILALGQDQQAERFSNIEKWCNQNGKGVVHLKRTEGISSSVIKERLLMR